jgi:hypothetical protein
MQRLVISSPHRYPDLARLWHRWVMRDLAPAFTRAGVNVEVNIFCDVNAKQFAPQLFPGVRFTESGTFARDHMDFYDAALVKTDCDFLFFVDSDVFFFDTDWAAGQFRAFDDPQVAAISYVWRKGRPASFALLCRTAAYRALPAPVFACRYEFPDNWPGGANLEIGDFAARELARNGKTIVNIGDEESSQHVANFRSSTAFRATRERISEAAGEAAFEQCLAQQRPYINAAYDNILLNCLYEALYGEPFAPDASGKALGGSVTLEQLRRVVAGIRDAKEIERLRGRFEVGRRNILRMAEREGVKITIPSVL